MNVITGTPFNVKTIFAAIASIGLALFIAFIYGNFGYSLGILFLLLPLVIAFSAILFLNPYLSLIGALIIGFLNSGLARYMPIPWGLGIDGLLVLGWIGYIFKNFRKGDWQPIRNDVSVLALVWFAYLLLELFNPVSPGPTAWFYAMRGIGFYQLLGFTLVFLTITTQKRFNQFFIIIFALSLLGTAWGFKQQILGPDAAENHWLYAENHHEEHVLHGVLRVFSFYSDAGQFGSSQAMIALMAGILFLGPFSMKKRLLFGAIALATFLGFAISGTRGALAVPAGGVLLYLIVSRNFKLLIAGLVFIGIVFYVLKFTFAFQSVEQVRRMRTALNPENPSLMVRLENQKHFRRSLEGMPMGGGVGSAGFWGARFAPNSPFAIATDSWYVKIWVETGIIGICFHLFLLGYVMGKGGVIIWNMKDQRLKAKVMALYAGVGGVLLSSYGNQVFGQMPTGMIMNIAIPLIFISTKFDKK